MKSELETKFAMNEYGDTVKRICLVHLKNEYDAQDIFQNVFLKYVINDKVFDSPEHEKAWIIRVTINECNDLKKRLFRRHISINEIPENYLTQNDNVHISTERQEVIKAVLSLPAKYRDSIYLYFFEDYKAVDIAKMLNKSENTIYTHIFRSKEMLKNILGGDYNE